MTIQLSKWVVVLAILAVVSNLFALSQCIVTGIKLGNLIADLEVLNKVEYWVVPADWEGTLPTNPTDWTTPSTGMLEQGNQTTVGVE